ncbi:MAG: Hsp70 family protein, partial [Eubacteriaceae bacterium]|nr:Hsp70 family protein [Eubacteriaceae bacterium]
MAVKYYGFDLGDAECALSVKSEGSQKEPSVIPVHGTKSFISAYATSHSGEVIIGETACYSPKATEARLRFKSRFLTDPMVNNDIMRFARAVLDALIDEGNLRPDSDNIFYIGCPAGWNKNDRERYRAIFENAGYPPAKVITESRAALMYACQSKHLQLSYDILSKPMLVVDMGSSTTDFAYINGGREVELQTAGEVFLGGGIMDEILLGDAVKAHPRSDRIAREFEESPSWHTYCEFAARKLKEKYFSDEDYWQERGLTQSVVIRNRLPVKLTLKIDKKEADRLLHEKVDRLGGRSFIEVFRQSLEDVREKTSEHPPIIVLLTGGVSKMPIIRKIVSEVFEDSVIVSDAEPEFSVSKGLAYTGETEAELRKFREELTELISSDTVETIVSEHIESLFQKVVDTLIEPILKNAAIPVFQRWRNGKIRTLNDIDTEMQKSISDYMTSPEVKQLLVKPIAEWMKPISAQLEEKTIPICVRHNVPYTSLSLVSFMELNDVDLDIHAEKVFALPEIIWLINAIISLMVGFLCGGSGVALITGGLPGILAGAAISLLVLLLGKEKATEAIMDADLPTLVRKALSEKFFESRTEQIKEKVRG